MGNLILNKYQDHILSRTIFVMFIHSHKIRKDSLGGGLDRVLFTAEPEFSKILVPRLLQHTSDVNTEYVGKSKQLQTLCDQPPGVLISLYYLDYFFVLILICVSINYAWLELCNMWLLFIKDIPRSINI